MILTFWLETNKVGSRVETNIDVDDDEWAELDANDREDYAREMFLDIALNRLGEWDWHEQSEAR